MNQPMLWSWPSADTRCCAADGAPRAPTPYNGFMKAELAKLKATQPGAIERKLKICVLA